MIENVSTQLTVFHCLCPLTASRKGLRLPLRSALFGEGGRDWRPCKNVYQKNNSHFSTKTYVVGTHKKRLIETVLLSTQNIC